MESVVGFVVLLVVVYFIIKKFGIFLACFFLFLLVIGAVYYFILVVSEKRKEKKKKRAEREAREAAQKAEEHRQEVEKVQAYILDFNRAYALDIVPFLEILAFTGSASGEYDVYRAEKYACKKLAEQKDWLNNIVAQNPGMTPADYHIK